MEVVAAIGARDRAEQAAATAIAAMTNERVSLSEMWNAVIASRAPTDLQDLYGLPERHSKANGKNFDNVVVQLLNHARTEVLLPYELDGKSGFQQRARVGLVAATEFNQLFDQLARHPEYAANIKAFRGFVKKATDDKKITDWAVVWTLPNTGGRVFDVPELGGNISIVKRSVVRGVSTSSGPTANTERRPGSSHSEIPWLRLASRRREAWFSSPWSPTASWTMRQCRSTARTW